MLNMRELYVINKSFNVPLFTSKHKVSSLPEKATEDFLRVLEEVPVPLQVLSVHDTNHQSLLYGRRLTGVMVHAVTHIPQRLDN